MSKAPTISPESSLGAMLQEIVRAYGKKEALVVEGRVITYAELDKHANRVANGLAKLGINTGDRVAIMLPNIPEFVFSFFGIQKLGAVAVPFNTLYKGREIVHILNDSGARGIITLASNVALINEVRGETPALEHVILAGQRTLVFVGPDSTVNIQFVMSADRFADEDEAYRRIGGVVRDALAAVGATEAEYRHRGAVRARGRKLATIIISQIENVYVVNAVAFLGPLKTEEFFRVIWVTPEVKDKVVEPMTSVEELAGTRPSVETFAEALFQQITATFGQAVSPSNLERDELFGYEKTRALAYRRS